MTKTNKVELTLERRSEMLDLIIRNLATMLPPGDLLQLCWPSYNGHSLSELMSNHECDNGEHPFQELGSECTQEEIRALFVPYLAPTLQYHLDLDVKVGWTERA